MAAWAWRARPSCKTAHVVDAEVTTLIATVVVALAAVASLLMNGRAGRHARRSAEAAERAAIATLEATAATRAATAVDLQLWPVISRHTGFEGGTVSIRATAASIWIHEVRLTTLVDGSGYNIRDDVCSFLEGYDAPVFVHRGNACVCSWPEPLPAGRFHAWFAIRYSFERDGELIPVQLQVAGEVEESRIRPP
jgi:hypothetical protein